MFDEDFTNEKENSMIIVTIKYAVFAHSNAKNK